MKCLICKKETNSFVGLGTHISRVHGNVKDYYDKFLKKENEGLCECGKETKFKSLSVGYGITCSNKCSTLKMSSSVSREKAKQTILKKYGVMYPSQIETSRKIISEKAMDRYTNDFERKKTSISTKNAVNDPIVRERYLKNKKPISDKGKKSISDKMKEKHLDKSFQDKIYTKERNEKISISKKLYWKEHPEERERIMSIWKNLGETSLEKKMYEFLNENKIKYEKRYELEQKQYDAYLIDYNLLLEFDGEFWHKQTINECKYTFQTFNFYNDIRKNEIAKNHNIPLLRIRESESPQKILDYIKSI